MRISLKIFGLLWMSQTVHASVLFGVDQIQDNYRLVHYPAYVQVGSFSTIRAAERLKHQMHVGTNVPAIIQSSKGRYRVRLGPFQNQSSLKSFANNMASDKHPQQFNYKSSAGLLQTAPRSMATIPVLRPVQTHVSADPVLPGQRLTTSRYVTRQGSHPELSVFLGGSYIPNTIKGQTLQLLPYEIGPYADTFTHQSNAGAFTWGVDALYRFKLHSPSTQHYFFDSLGAGVDMFQVTNFHQTGNVLQFNLPEFENYTYTLKLNNIRVMANFDLDFHPLRQRFIPFIQGGVGGARTAVSYNSDPISPVVGPNFTLPTQASWNFAYQAGAGLKYTTNTPWVLSLRYLYANMGNVHSSTLGSSATLATPLTVNMSTQSILFGLTYAVA